MCILISKICEVDVPRHACLRWLSVYNHQALTFEDFLMSSRQDPLKASDKPLTDCGPYMLDEEDAMVYRRPYLTSGASGFALVALSRNLKNELKASISI